MKERKGTIPIVGERIKEALKLRNKGLREFGRELAELDTIQLRSLQNAINLNRIKEADLTTICILLDVSPSFIKGDIDTFQTFSDYEMFTGHRANSKALQTFLITRGFTKKHSDLTGLDWQKVPADWFYHHAAELELAVSRTIQRIIDKAEDI